MGRFLTCHILRTNSIHNYAKIVNWIIGIGEKSNENTGKVSAINESC